MLDGDLADKIIAGGPSDEKDIVEILKDDSVFGDEYGRRLHDLRQISFGLNRKHW